MSKSQLQRRSDDRIRWAVLLSALIIVAAACVMPLFQFARVRASNPTGGTLAPAGPTVNWVGTVSGTGGTLGEGNCIDSGPAQNCDSFQLTIGGAESDWSGKLAQVRVAWNLPSTDYDLYVHKGDLTGPVAASGANQGQPGTEEVAFIDPQATGVGLYTVHVGYAVVPPNGDQYHGTASPVPGLTPAPAGSGLAPRFQNLFPTPGQIAQGKGVDAGEPSVGINWVTGKGMYVSYLTTFRLTFDDTCPTSPTAVWEDKSAPNSVNSLDPILFTDHGYNTVTPDVKRTFVSQLSGQDSLSAYTDDDGETWIPSQGGGIPSGVDHQSVGSGPFHAPLTGGVPGFQHAVYYCSQDIATAFCARSDNGGVTFGAGVPIYGSNTSCSGLHGHVKVGPDGTVYVPNRSCNTLTVVIVSEDNGITWNIRAIPGSNTSSSDPAVAVGRGDVVTTGGLTPAPVGRLYAAFGSSDTSPGVSVSDDHGLTWKNSFDVGELGGIKAVAFPTIVAGDDDRAAYAFLGSTSAGAPDAKTFPGLWHLYVATTYDGGAHWLLSDATPNDPVQRNGIHLGGGSPPHRNLLDFIGIDVDKQGRIVVGYADGCTGPACIQAPNTATGNSYTQIAAVARQSGGRRLFAGSDPAEPTIPGAPYLTVGRDARLDDLQTVGVAHLTWSEPNDGGSAVTNYAVLRGTTSGGETFLANVGTATSYNDNFVDLTTNYYYKVTATNGQGSSCGSNEVKSVPIGDSQCAGLTEVIDPAGDQKSAPANADLDVLEVRAADDLVSGNQRVTFKLKVANLGSPLLPNRQWRILWNYPTPPDATTAFTGSYYVGMNTDGTGIPSFEYGTVTTVESVPANASLPNLIGPADSGSIDQANGIISIVLSANKIGNPKIGDIIGAMIGRTFAGNGTQTLRSNSAIDTTNAAGAQDPYTGMSYRLVGNASCYTAGPTPTPTPTPSPTPTPTPGGSTIQFGSPSFAKTEGCTFINITVVRSGSTAASASVDYTTHDGTAQQHGDYEFAAGRLIFNPGQTSRSIPVLINEDGYVEGAEALTLTLSNPLGDAVLGPDTSTTLNINDNDPSTPNTNPIDDPATFVCQHYHDFLNREPDANGQAYWTNEITKCGNDQQCIRNRRVGVSASFFVEDEFQDTGSFVYLIYKEALVRRLTYTEFMRDRNRLHAGTNLSADRVALAEEFVQRSEFVTKYPLSQSASEYVDALIQSVNQSSGLDITAHKTELVNEYNSGGTQENRRARVLVKVVDYPEVVDAEYTRAFVLAEYFGYLRRNAEDEGYNFWVNVLANREPGNYRGMVCAFLTSQEYQERFGAIVTHSNSECGSIGP
jgi:hypothetical protein